MKVFLERCLSLNNWDVVKQQNNTLNTLYFYPSQPCFHYHQNLNGATLTKVYINCNQTFCLDMSTARDLHTSVLFSTVFINVPLIGYLLCCLLATLCSATVLLLCNKGDRNRMCKCETYMFS